MFFWVAGPVVQPLKRFAKKNKIVMITTQADASKFHEIMKIRDQQISNTSIASVGSYVNDAAGTILDKRTSSLTQTRNVFSSLCHIPRASGQSRAIRDASRSGDTGLSNRKWSSAGWFRTKLASLTVIDRDIAIYQGLTIIRDL